MAKAPRPYYSVQRLDKGRRILRRRIAVLSFGVLIAYSVATLVALLASPNRSDIAAALMTTFPLTSVLLTTFTGIIVAYLGVSSNESLRSGAAERAAGEDQPVTVTTETDADSGKTTTTVENTQ